MNKSFFVAAVLLLSATNAYAQDYWAEAANECGANLQNWGSVPQEGKCCVVSAVQFYSDSTQAWKQPDTCESNGTCEIGEICCGFKGEVYSYCYGATRKLDTNGPLSISAAAAPGSYLAANSTSTSATTTMTTSPASPSSSASATTMSVSLLAICATIISALLF